MPQVSRLGGVPAFLRDLAQALGENGPDAAPGAADAPGQAPARRPQVPDRPPALPPVVRDRREVTAGQGAAAIRDTRPRTERFKLQIDLVANRIYVINKDTGKPIDKFLTSPGTADHPTAGDSFAIKDIYSLPTWYPPKSKWAEGLKPVGPGPDNPLGLLALDLGQHHQLIHGVGKSKYKLLGQPASHGCLRMSNENVLLLYSKYAARGMQVEVNRDPEKSNLLRAQASAAGVRDRNLADGSEFYADAVKGKLPPLQ
ncbi:MAG: L,D-transpeptidase [Candidatus Sericytochromatia bacterium]|nr:L,D-transpeptidase [Candidatus Sericytochromatia bacterium]